MNKQRRKALELLNTDLENIKETIEAIEEGKIEQPELEAIKEKTADVQSQLETLRDEEQEYYDNMPEGLQAGEKGDKAQEAVDNLDSAVSETETAHDSIEEAINAEDDEGREGALEAARDEIDNAINSINSAVEV